jgi:dTMP kinase
MKKRGYSGKFIVFEGLDGAGTESLSKAFLSYFKKKGVRRIHYPDYSESIGKTIHQYLHREYDLPVEVQFFLYFFDFVKDIERIEQWLKEGKIVIADRYFTSTLAYQGLRGFPQKVALDLARFFKLPKPDLIIYLEVSPETSTKRKLREKGSLDRNEVNRKFLSRLAKFYKGLIKKRIFGKWVVIDGEGTVKEVFEKVNKIIKKKLKI